MIFRWGLLCSRISSEKKCVAFNKRKSERDHLPWRIWIDAGTFRFVWELSPHWDIHLKREKRNCNFMTLRRVLRVKRYSSDFSAVYNNIIAPAVDISKRSDTHTHLCATFRAGDRSDAIDIYLVVPIDHSVKASKEKSHRGNDFHIYILHPHTAHIRQKHLALLSLNRQQRCALKTSAKKCAAA